MIFEVARYFDESILKAVFVNAILQIEPYNMLPTPTNENLT